jgi:hypothetical protein
MNERIKQLSIEAGFPEWSNHAIEFELEQFAELIVWECMKICEDVMKKDNSALGCWSEIKRTFRS